MLKVRINRAEWDVVENKICKLGENLTKSDYEGMLYNPKTQLLCCLGFVGLTCNISKEDMQGLGEPEEVDGIFSWPPSLGSVENKLMEINDDQILIGSQKEPLIMEKGKLADIDFEFYGEYLKKEVNE